MSDVRQRLQVAAQTLKFLGDVGFPYTPTIDDGMIEAWAESMNGVTSDVAKRACLELSRSCEQFPSLAQFIAQTRLIRRVDATRAQETQELSGVSEYVRSLQGPGIATQRAIRARKQNSQAGHRHLFEDASGCPVCSRAKQEQWDHTCCVACEELEAHGLQREHHRRL